MEDETGALSRATTTYKGWPLWARIAAPTMAALVGITALGGAAEEEPVEIQAVAELSSSTTSTPTEDVDVASLVTDAPEGFGTGDMESIVTVACESLAEADTAGAAAATFQTIEAAVDGLTDTQLGDVVDVLDEVAPQACPDAVADHPMFLRELAALAPEPIVTTTTAAPTTTVPPTTLPPTTLPPTTLPPVTSPPATAPPATAPPATAAPQPAASTTYYKNCDAAKAAGAAPVHRGDPGYGAHLDRDDDGVGCER